MDRYLDLDGVTDVAASYHDTWFTPADNDLAAEADRYADELERNGQLYRVRDAQVAGDTLELEFERVDYATFLATNEAGAVAPVNQARPLSVGALIAGDGYTAVLGKRDEAAVQEAAGAYGLPSGYVQESLDGLVPDLSPEVNGPVYREVMEELGLPYEDVDGAAPVALMAGENGQPMLLYRFETGLDEQELAERRNTRGNDEFEHLLFLDDDTGTARENGATLTDTTLQLTDHAALALDTYDAGRNKNEQLFQL